MKLDLHAETLCNLRFESGQDLVFTQGKGIEFPSRPHEKHSHLYVHMLIYLQDVPIIGIQEAGNFRDYPFLVRALDEENGLFHKFCLTNSKSTKQLRPAAPAYPCRFWLCRLFPHRLS